MDENQTTETTQVETGTTVETGTQTQSTAVNVDIESVAQKAAEKAAEIAAKKYDAVFKSVLEQNKVDTETAQSLLAERKKPDEKQTDSTETPELKALREEVERIAAEREKEKADREKDRAKLESIEQANILKAKDVPDTMLRFYQSESAAIARETGISFEDAFAKVLESTPIPPPLPDMATGKPKSDETKKAYKVPQLF